MDRRNFEKYLYFYGRLLFRFSVWVSSPNIMDKINPNPTSNAHLQLVTHIYSKIWGIYIYQQTYFGSAGSTWDAKTIKIAYEGDIIVYFVYLVKLLPKRFRLSASAEVYKQSK